MFFFVIPTSGTPKCARVPVPRHVSPCPCRCRFCVWRYTIVPLFVGANRAAGGIPPVVSHVAYKPSKGVAGLGETGASRVSSTIGTAAEGAVAGLDSVRCPLGVRDTGKTLPSGCSDAVVSG